MNKIEFQTYPDGTQVRFTDDARRSMAGITGRHGLRPLGPRKSDPHGVFTITNTDDNLHDVILNESGERWGIDWLEEVEDDEYDESADACPACDTLPSKCHGGCCEDCNHANSWHAGMVTGSSGS